VARAPGRTPVGCSAHPDTAEELVDFVNPGTDRLLDRPRRVGDAGPRGRRAARGHRSGGWWSVGGTPLAI